MRVIHFAFVSLLLLMFMSEAGQIPVSALPRSIPSPDAQDSTSSPAPTDEEYEIWTLALKDVVEQSKPPETILVENETNAGGAYDLQGLLDTHAKEPVRSKREEEWLALRSELLADTIANFKLRNLAIDFLSNRFRTPLPTILITHKEEAELSDKSPGHFWETLRQKYPDAIGIFTLSRVGFNSQKTQAVVYVAYRSGEEGGDGRYVLLQRKDGVWIRQRSAIAWMS